MSSSNKPSSKSVAEQPHRLSLSITVPLLTALALSTVDWKNSAVASWQSSLVVDHAPYPFFRCDWEPGDIWSGILYLHVAVETSCIAGPTQGFCCSQGRLLVSYVQVIAYWEEMGTWKRRPSCAPTRIMRADDPLSHGDESQSGESPSRLRGHAFILEPTRFKRFDTWIPRVSFIVHCEGKYLWLVWRCSDRYRKKYMYGMTSIRMP